MVCPTEIEVSERAGYVTVTCERSGDLSLRTEVNLTTQSTIPEQAVGVFCWNVLYAKYCHLNKERERYCELYQEWVIDVLGGNVFFW